MAKRVVDIVFLVDATGSMEPCIEGLRHNISRFVEGILGGERDGGYAPVVDWRAKVVGFRDYEFDGPEKWFVDNPFTHDAAELQRQLEALEAIGGGDQPESLLDAICAVARMGESARGEERADCWRARQDAARCVIVFTDAPYKPEMVVPEFAGGTLMDVGNVCVSQRLLLTVVTPRGNTWDEQYVRMQGIRYCSWIGFPCNGNEIDWNDVITDHKFMKYLSRIMPIRNGMSHSGCTL